MQPRKRAITSQSKWNKNKPMSDTILVNIMDYFEPILRCILCNIIVQNTIVINNNEIDRAIELLHENELYDDPPEAKCASYIACRLSDVA